MTMTLTPEMVAIERKAFEEFVGGTSGYKTCAKRGKPFSFRQNGDGSYWDFRVNDRWGTWLARARLEAGISENKWGTNSGHGHVWERPDGIKARCGGPGICRECASDASRYT